MSKLICAALIYILFLFPSQGSAQPDSIKSLPKSNIAASAGICFSSRAIFNPASNSQWMDYLEPGFNAQLSAELPLFHSHFGIKASFDYYGNYFNMAKFTSQQEDSSKYSRKYTTVSSVSYGAFNQLTLLVGPFVSYSFGKTTITAWVTGGVEYLSLPNTEINIMIIDTVQANYNSTAIYTTKLAFAIDEGISFSYSFNKKICATLSLSFLYANVSYGRTEYDDYIQHIDYTYLSSGIARIAVFSSSLGIKYVF